MKILILGGNRFFGRRLAASLADSHDVTLLNRQSKDDGLGGKVRRIKADRTDFSVNEDYDVVYDQICYEPEQARRAVEIFSGRTGRYIFTSSQSVYGPGASLSESQFDPYTYRFDHDSKDYAEAKRQCEAVFFHQSRLPVVAIRFPIVCGPDDYTGRLKWHVDHVKAGQPMKFPAIDAHLSLIHAKDAANVLASLGLMDFTGPLNVCADEPIQLRKLVGVIEEKLGKKAQFGGEDVSPYGIDGDWFMSTAKLRSLGLQAEPIMSWLPSEV
jgi:nucleoside-diphosphate-sugar epimerase